MDVLTFLKQGNVSPNPDYNPKTKKGALQPPYLVNYTPGASTSDRGIQNIVDSSIPTIYDLNKFQNGQYYEHDVIPNYFDTEEELNRERAENQSGIEQAGRFLGQVVASEIVLGTIRGFSDLVDGAINIYGEATDDEHINDYTNPVSEALASAQEDIRENLAIYETDPNSSFNIFDSGWWFNGLTSIASTLSLAIPGTGIAKIGKVAGLGKVANAVGRQVGRIAGKPRLYGELAEKGSDIMGQAFLMRTAENYIEARDTYTTVYDEVNNRLNAMTPEQRAKFDEDNPQFVGKNNEEIAKYIAGESADDTFKNDFGLMLLDAWQLKSLKNVWKGIRSSRATQEIIDANNRAIRGIIGETVEAPTKAARLRRLVGLNNFRTASAELSEGFEEAYQYYQQQNAIDNGIHAIDASHRVKTFNDYLSDPEMWENAFWGWIGGVAFQGIAGASGRAWNKYVSKAKDATTEYRKAEIEGRVATLNNFVNRMQILNDSRDPDRPIRDNNNNVQGYEELNPTIAEAKKKSEIKATVTQMTLQAAKRGNYDLLKEFFTSSEFDKYMTDANVMDENERKSFINGVAQQMDKVYEQYDVELKKVYKNDVSDPSIASRIAEENTATRIALEEQDEIIVSVQNDINKAVNDINNIDVKSTISSYEQDLERAGYEREIQYTADEIKKLDDQLKKKKISKIEHAYRRKRLLELQDKFVKAAGYDNLSEFDADTPNHLTGKQAIESLKRIDESLLNAIMTKSMANRTKMMIKDNIADTNIKIKDRAKYIENTFKLIQDESFRNSLDELDAIFDGNDIEAVESYIINHSKNNPLSDEVKRRLDSITRSINVLSPSDQNLADIIAKKAQDARKRKANNSRATVNGQPVQGGSQVINNAPPAPDNINNNSTNKTATNSTAESSSSPTGEQLGNINSSTTGNISNTFEVGDVLTMENYDANGNVTQRYDVTITEVFPNGGFKIDNGVEFTKRLVDIYFGTSNTSRGADTRIINNSRLGAPRNQQSNNARPEGIAGSSPVEDGANPDNAVQSVLQANAAEEEARFNSSAAINNLALNSILRNRDTALDNLDEAAQIEYLKNQLLQQGVDAAIIDMELPKQVRSLNMIRNAVINAQNNNSNDDSASALDVEIGKMLTAEQEQQHNNVKDLLTKYVEINHGLRVGDKYAININNLMQYIRNTTLKDNQNFNLFKEIYDIVKTELKNGIDGVQVIDRNNLNLNDEQLAQILSRNPESETKQAKNVGIFGNSIDREYLATLSVGSVLEATVGKNSRGVDFWHNGHHVGFNFRPEATPDANGYIFNSLNLGVSYRIWSDGNGNILSDLDEIFDKIYPFRYDNDGNVISEDYSKEAKELLEFMMAIQNQSTTNISDFNDKLITFAKTDLGQKLVNILNNKNINVNNITKGIRYLNSIYFYNYTGNLADDYDSYQNFIKGQFENFQMTDKIYNGVRNGDVVDVKISYLSRGTLIVPDVKIGPQKVNIALANYNPNDYHLASVLDANTIEDSNTGDVIIAKNFRRTALSVIVPNGNNAPTFVELLANNINKDQGIGLAIRQEVNKIIEDYLSRNILYRDALNKLKSIFGVRKLITGINVGEHEGKIVLFRNNDNYPIITLYSHDANGNPKPGLSMNFTPFGGSTISTNEITDSVRNNINLITDDILDGAKFAMSYDFARRQAPDNDYVKFDNNGMTVFGQQYVNYLDFIEKNNLALLNASTITLRDGSESNFIADDNMRMEIDATVTPKKEAENNIEQQRNDFITEEYNRGNHTVSSAIDFLHKAAPGYNFDNINVEAILPKSFEIRVGEDAYDKERDAGYDPRTNTIYITSRGLGLKVDNDGNRTFSPSTRQKLIRILMHERIHQQLAAHNVMNNIRFYKEIRDIRNRFAEIVNGNIPQELINFANNNYNLQEYIDNLRKFVDYTNSAYNGKSDEYRLEEFVVEALTSPVLSQALNNINSSNPQTPNQKQTLWTRIINWIRKVFGLGDINTNSMLNDVYTAFVNNFDEAGNAINKTNNNSDDSEGSSPVGDKTKSADNAGQLIDDDYLPEDSNDRFDDEDIDFASSLDVASNSISVPSVSSTAARLTAGEAAQFTTLLDRGDINYLCN